MIVDLLLVIAAVSATEAAFVQEVICAETRFSRAAEAKDPDAFIAWVDPDARFISGRVSRGRDEVRDAWSAILSPEGPTMRWRPAVVEVAADGQLAISRGPYRAMSVDEDGELVESWGHFISTWRRNDEGRWQVLFDTGGDAGMTPSEEDVNILQSDPECT